MKVDRVGQIWEVGDRVYLVARVKEATDAYVLYDGLILNDDVGNAETMRDLYEVYDDQWERMVNSSRRLA